MTTTPVLAMTMKTRMMTTKAEEPAGNSGRISPSSSLTPGFTTGRFALNPALRG